MPSGLRIGLAVFSVIILSAIAAAIVYYHRVEKKKVYLPVDVTVTETKLDDKVESHTSGTSGGYYDRYYGPRRTNVVIHKRKEYFSNYLSENYVSSSTSTKSYLPIICVKYKIPQTGGADPVETETPPSTTPETPPSTTPETPPSSTTPATPETTPTTSETPPVTPETTPATPETPPETKETEDGETVRCFDHYSGYQSMSSAQNVINQFPIGKKFKLYYDQSNPNEIKWSQDPSSFPWIGLGIVGLFMIVIPLIILFGQSRRRGYYGDAVHVYV